MLSLRMSFKYVGLLTVLTAGEYGIVIDKKVKEIEVSGDQIISGNLETIPQQMEEPKDSDKTKFVIPEKLVLLVILLAVIAVAGLYAIGQALERESKKNLAIIDYAPSTPKKKGIEGIAKNQRQMLVPIGIQEFYSSELYCVSHFASAEMYNMSTNQETVVLDRFFHESNCFAELFKPFSISRSPWFWIPRQTSLYFHLLSLP